MYENTEETDMLSGKLIEYIASGSPIINFSNSGMESQNVLKLSKKSFNANSFSLDKVVKFINAEYNEWKAGNYRKYPIDNIESLSRILSFDLPKYFIFERFDFSIFDSSILL